MKIANLRSAPARALLLTAALGCGLVFATSRGSALKESAAATVALGPNVPTDIADPSDPQQAATFAWQEFVAMTWPAAVNPSPGQGLSPYFRGQPSTAAGSGQTGPNGVTVWETLYHRAELYPTYASGAGNLLPDPNAIPNYNYAGSGSQPFTPAPGTDLTLFNNLDEASEITLAYMYFTPLAQKVDALMAQYPQPNAAQQAQIEAAAIQAGIVYEAKGNGVIFNYLKANSFNNAAPRRRARAQAIALINNQTTTGPIFSLPSGSLEIKATWRHYNEGVDDLSKFHWAKGIYYTTDSDGNKIASNDTFLLIGLHIIQKTPNVPTFTFATFEHVSNETNGFRFVNTDPQTYTPPGFGRALPDPGVIEAIRQFPIPGAGSAFNLAAFNAMMQAQLRSQFGASNVWANYQLIGIQALVQDDPGGPVPPQQFFLSNFATETNDSLQFFQGGLTGKSGVSNVPDPDAAHVFTINTGTNKYQGHTAGGCLGCHGSQGQFQGGDFSVIAATGNAFTPEPVTPYPGGPVTAQNPNGFPLPHQSMAMRIPRRSPAVMKGR
jgi:hypothetical protein